MYAKGSSTAINVGTGLTSPTGVAVDGAGDVFIADSGTRHRGRRAERAERTDGRSTGHPEERTWNQPEARRR